LGVQRMRFPICLTRRTANGGMKKGPEKNDRSGVRREGNLRSAAARNLHPEWRAVPTELAPRGWTPSSDNDSRNRVLE
jgi:hypothetical protein